MDTFCFGVLQTCDSYRLANDWAHGDHADFGFDSSAFPSVECNAGECGRCCILQPFVDARLSDDSTIGAYRNTLVSMIVLASSSSFSLTANFAMGSLAQISSGKIRCGFNTRFRARFRRVLEGSGAAVLEGSRCRYLVRFRRVPVQIPGEVLPDGSGW